MISVKCPVFIPGQILCLEAASYEGGGRGKEGDLAVGILGSDPTSEIYFGQGPSPFKV